MPSELLRLQGKTPASDTKTVRNVTFDVPEGTRTLALKYDYGPRVATNEAVLRPLVEAAFELHTRRRRAAWSPEELERQRQALNLDGRARSMNNLMNVTLIDPTGQWRGRWDRNPSSDDGYLVLGEALASRGFLPGPLPAGKWIAAVECHGVFGDAVAWELVLEAREPLGEADAAQLASRVAPHPRSATKAGPGWYFGEMHSHTVHSDGKWEVEELANRVAATGADFLCLTDHNTMSGHRSPPALPVTLIRGIELTTFYGHHPVYGIAATVPWHADGRVRSLAEMAPEVRRSGGIVGVAHPFVPGDPLCTGCRMPEGLDARHFDTMEIWYRRWHSPGADNVAAHALWNELWRRGHRVIGVGARDVHGPDQEGPFPGDMPLTGIWAEENSEAAILAGLKAGRVIVSSGPSVTLSLQADSAEAHLGDTLRTATPPRAKVRVTGLEGEGTLRLFESGEPTATHALRGSGDLVLPLSGQAAGWCRVELWRGDAPLTFTNHVLWERP